MMKFVIFATLIVAFAATELEDATRATCKADSNAEAIKCPACVGKETSSECTKAAADDANLMLSLSCSVLVECYKQAAKNVARKAAEKMNEKYAKLCPSDKAKCVDKDSYCPTWAKGKPSQCTENPDWMLLNCQNSCCPICTGKNTLAIGTCPKKDREDLCVKNTNDSCHAWATQTPESECDKNPDWMKVNCMQSCCDTCKKDKDGCPTVKKTCKNSYAATEGNKKCEDWAKAGECRVNPVWMKKNCAKECCPICQPVAPAKGVTQTITTPVRLAQQLPRQQVVYAQQYQLPQPIRQSVAFGGYNTGIPQQQVVRSQPVRTQQQVLPQPIPYTGR